MFDLKAGNIKDEKGNTYPVYMDISDEGVVSLNKNAMHIFKVIGCALSH
jgi:hypothetical protein